MSPPNRTEPQLSFDVRPHPGVAHMSEPILSGSLKITGELHCPVDVHTGDELTVSVATADGQVIAQAVVEAGAPGFRVLTDKGEPIGMERVTKAKVA